ncbi:hypothetical protein GCM10009716_38200 [Streptomyces sodiiphilus]|uniref:Uncharacterized protein n=2 Tax=Streptomyces sodiiphilus TaxID=226217 RepID=A0ABN2PNQ7_9ACTN
MAYTPAGYRLGMVSFTKDLTSSQAGRACAPLCRPASGAVDITLLRRVLGVCLQLRVELSGRCRGR